MPFFFFFPQLYRGEKKIPYFTHFLLVFGMVLSVSMKIGTIKKHFQQFSKHTVMPAAIYE